MTTTGMRRGLELVAVAGATAAINFAFLVYAGRKLGPAEYSDFWAAMSLLFFGTLFLNPLAPFASHVAARAVAQGAASEVPAFRRAMQRLTVGPAIPFVAIAALVSGLLASFLHLRSAAVVIVTAAAIAAYAVLSVERGLFQGLGRFREYNVNTIIESTFRMTAAVVLLGLAPTAKTAMGVYLGGLLVALAALLPRRMAAAGAAETAVDVWKDVRGTGISMFVLMASMAVFQNADSLVVKRWFHAHDAAAYAAAAALSRTFTALAAPLWVLLVPTVASARGAGRAAVDALRICGGYVASSALLMWIAGAFSTQLYARLYGAAFVDAAPLLVPLSGVVVLINVSLLCGQTLIGISRHRMLYVVLATALVEIIALSLYHRSVAEVIRVLYVIHASLAAVLAGAVVRAVRS